MAASQVVIPKEVSEFIDLVAERYGYYVAKRLKLSEMMKATKTERSLVRALGQKIGSLFSEYITEGKDVRAEIKADQEELAKARATLKAKSKPYYDAIRPLNKALSYLDKEVIPQRLEQLGKPVKPIFKVDPAILKAITK